jgi:hypothetical protein
MQRKDKQKNMKSPQAIANEGFFVKTGELYKKFQGKLLCVSLQETEKVL